MSKIVRIRIDLKLVIVEVWSSKYPNLELTLNKQTHCTKQQHSEDGGSCEIDVPEKVRFWNVEGRETSCFYLIHLRLK